MQMNTKKPHPVDVEVGKRILLRRKMIGMSQGTLGTALGITFQQVQKYEKGTNRVGSSRLSHIAQILGVPVSYFFGELSAADNKDDSIALNDPVMAFLATDEGRQLNIAFGKISSPAIRKRVVGLVAAISKGVDEA
ncbi:MULTISPECIES: helix-turn-helix transcriptional regulator [unclassified Agrobacterium]|uniref:helix-turn-helix domain-containing protein n=1 Tax=unclassified Agrobacterium TaxID=2632611 RepID=UPI002446C2D3|nr:MULTISPECIES: helix-turn-helix transcriptional regulator [unclassified Agrobacterium]MDH0615599.1 helix-turn-helix domain-containing protein [Agrobacterium sp. GD03872]MDH0698738.1 helix-turn-helix domain-containing protein [Agrobacterium sp. GD03871]MDH1061411.1 helix-turn-helix domain-containing protein [Agrobacterium sp. GD03992]MDH2212654.1 helix-turn-helix domain-containing protein [Agrobacterium sp. GD03643]MDH2220993.1 helix-turn-helix domain-containing protein [Agrobacterium sp. GD0